MHIRDVYTDDVPHINDLYGRQYGHYPYPLTTQSSVFQGGVGKVAICDGNVVGFARATPYGEGDDLFEFGGIIVAERYRGRGIGKALTSVRLQEVRHRGARTVFTEPVCYCRQLISQRNIAGRGFVLTGLQPWKYPGIKADMLGGQPESVTMAVRQLAGDVRFGQRKIFVPDEMRAEIMRIMPGVEKYRGQSVSVSGEMPDVIEHQPIQYGERVGAEFVDIPMNTPACIQLIEEWSGRGYVFSAVLPGFGRTSTGSVCDYVRMVRLPCWRALRLDLVHVHPNVASLKRFFGRQGDRMNGESRL